MKVSLSKSEIRGKVAAPPSKSYTIRGLMCAALAKGKSELIYPLSSDDTEAAREVLEQLGISIHKKGDSWQVAGGQLKKPTKGLFCHDSAATFRFMTAICALVPKKCQLLAGSTLSKRPVTPLLQALRQLGVNCHTEDTSVIVYGGRLKGKIAELPGDISSQFVSALLLISPLAEEAINIRLTSPPKSKPYLEMTLDCMEKFGINIQASKDFRKFEVLQQEYRPTSYQIEGDWSSASYLLALGVILGEVTIVNLNLESLQGDKIVLNLLKNMGAWVSISDNSVTVQRSKLKAITADLSDCIDLLPTLAILAAVANGESRLTGIKRARLKESNRVAALREGLTRMGIKVIEETDSLTIIGSEPNGSIIDSQDDHRIAMAFSILGAVTGETTIDGAECVRKTYPEFWDVLKSLGGKVEIDVK
jgi:3-phosphoshikimate 1-carboxyvinyltransferase|tara:strand:+ start:3227 stop:4486 length:1260 start_codon:yes stop_codon:yes gene_type:complete